MEEANVSTYSHTLAVCLSVHLYVLFQNKCFGKVNRRLKHLLSKCQNFCLLCRTVYIQRCMILNKYVVYNFFYRRIIHVFINMSYFYNLLIRLFFNLLIKPYNFMNLSVFEILFIITSVHFVQPETQIPLVNLFLLYLVILQRF